MIGAGVGALTAGALAGSFVASCGAVKTGAIITYAMLKAGGVGVTSYMIYDNLNNAVNYTPHVFWSGGDVVKGASQNFANQVPNYAIVYSVQNPDGIRLLSTWATIDFPTLVNKGVEIICKILGWM